MNPTRELVIDLHTASLETGLDAETSARAIESLRPDEVQRYHRYIPERRRGEFLAGRIMLRSLLSRYLERDPSEIDFIAGEHGKLELAEDLKVRVAFNLSHTPGLVAVALAPSGKIGVDVERVDPSRATAAIAERHFSDIELADLSRLSDSDYVQRFHQIWVLKEAFIKAQGLGLALPLKDFHFNFELPGAINAGFAPSLAENPARWQFHLLAPSPDYHLAIALGRSDGDPLPIRVHPLLDLASQVS